MVLNPRPKSRSRVSAVGHAGKGLSFESKRIQEEIPFRVETDVLVITTVDLTKIIL